VLTHQVFGIGITRLTTYMARRSVAIQPGIMAVRWRAGAMDRL